MIDIDFYMKTHTLLEHNEDATYELFEEYRNKQPVVYNIETTNACNMKCEMCPRTTRMTRPIETMKPQLFIDIVNQLRPHSAMLWNRWTTFCKTRYNIAETSPASENHFFLYVISKVIQLHGYGSPLLDKNMTRHIDILTDHGFESYFSCNPSNINVEKVTKMMKNGLSYIKFSIESVDDSLFKKIRGDKANFTNSYKKICELLSIKEKNSYDTVFVITMLDLNRKTQAEDYKKLKQVFTGKDVYLYLKSEDQLWYRQDYHQTKSIHWSEFCRHPWMSMTIKSDGKVAMCMEDYNNEIILGDAKKDTLYDIWNNKAYDEFRRRHFDLNTDNKCVKECDMKLIGEYKI